jgi:hypothetical protein
MMNMHQRSEAARKAAATRAARKAAGFSGSTGPTKTTTKKAAFATPKLDARTVAFEALAKLEDALVARATESGITPEAAAAFEKYQKLKALALQPGTTHEGRTALRLATIELVKLVF